MLRPLLLLLRNWWQLQRGTSRRKRSEARGCAGRDLLAKYGWGWQEKTTWLAVMNSLYIAGYEAGKDGLSLHGRSVYEIPNARLKDAPHSTLALLFLFIFSTPAKFGRCASTDSS
jgi:hypothetical protein